MQNPDSSDGWTPPVPPPPTPGSFGAPPPPPPVPTSSGSWTPGPPAAHSRSASGVDAQGSTDLARGFAFALAAACAGGAAFWLISTATGFVSFYVAFGIGFAASAAAAKGTRFRGAALGVVAGVATMIAMVGALYFIYRTQLVKELGSKGRVPIWLGFSIAGRLMRIGISASPLVGLSALASIVIATVKGAKQ
jgi:hypothetical protein